MPDLLTRQTPPLSNGGDPPAPVKTQPLAESSISFEDLFPLAEIQIIQDEFALATGVASIITRPDGTPITAPSNFTHLCRAIIRKTERGCSHCFKSNALLGGYHPDGPVVQRCLSGGLWDAGASLIVGGQHVANWVIGQVRDEAQTEENMRAYAREIGADEAAFMAAFRAVPAMTLPHFEQVARALLTLVRQLSTNAYQNIQQARFLRERERVETALRESEEKFSRMFHSNPMASSLSTKREGRYLDVNAEFLNLLQRTRDEVIGRTSFDLDLWVDPQQRAAIMSRLEERGTVRDFEFDVRIKSGQIRRVLWSGEAVVLSGEECLVGSMQDITERRRTEAALRESESKLRIVFEGSPDAIGITKQGIHVLGNPAYLKLFGFEKNEQIAGSSLLNHIAPSHRQQVLQNVERRAAGENAPAFYETRGITANGREFEMEIRISTYKSQGEIYSVATLRDITERKEAEVALAESQSLIRAIIDSTSDAIWSVDARDFGMQTFNRSLKDHFRQHRGIDLQVGQRLEDLFPDPNTGPPIITFWKGLYQRALDSGSFTTEYTASSGTNTLLLTLSPLKRDEVVFGVSVFGRDITLHKQALAALSGSEERYRLAERAVDDGLWDWNILTDEEYFSPRFKEIAGCQEDDLPNHRAAFLKLVHPKDLALVNQVMREHLERGRRYEVEYRLRHKDGSYRWVCSRAEAVRDATGRPVRMVGAIMDITERKQAEEAFRATERALRTISACHRVLVLTADEAGLVQQLCQIIVEQGGYRMACIGWAENDERKSVRIVAQAGFDEGYLEQARISWSEDDERGRGPVGTAIRTGRMVVCNDFQNDPITLPWRTEAARHGYNASITLPLAHTGQSFGVLGIYAARTNAYHEEEIKLLSELADDLANAIYHLRIRAEHRQAQAALSESEERYRRIFAVETDAIVLVDRQTHQFIDVNPAAEQMFGYCREEFLRLKATDISAEPEKTKKIIASEPSRVPLRLLRRKNGTVFPAEISTSLFDWQNRSIHMAALRDITERQRAEERAGLLLSALTYAANAIAITDSGGKIEWVNPAFTRLTGYSAEEAIGSNPRVLKSGRHPPAFYANLWTTIATGNVWHGELVNKRKDGRLYTEDTTITPVRGADGQIAHFVAIKQDVTERRQLEAQFRQAQKMEAIGTLAGGIAHDFNNILAIIFGCGYLLQQDREGNESAQENIRDLLLAANRAKDLVQQILTFSRQHEQNRQVIRLNTVVKEATKFLRASLPAQIKIETNLADDVPAVLADPTQIYQVTLNLATNALHAMEGQPGQLTISLEAFLPDQNFIEKNPGCRPMPHARLTVADTGHGMEAKTLEHIFEPFFTTKPVGKGTGLGLAVVHGIVQSHEAIISVESEVGRGTTFSLYFPAHTQPEAPAVADSGQLPCGHGQKVLLVDDEPLLTAVYQQVMRRLNYQVTTTNSAHEILRLFRENPGQFDLVITDLTMPEMNGLEVARQIHALRPGVPIVLASGHTEDFTAADLQEAGISELLKKPISMPILATLLHRLLGHSELDDRGG